jgi:hydroxymethylbilane synthase
VIRRRLRIATRRSPLALWQANYVKAEIERHHPDAVVELVEMTTAGDRWLAAPLSEIGGKGLFIKELEIALGENRADVAVHSMKDVPAQLAKGYALPVVAYRADVRDAFVSTRCARLADLPTGAVVGSSSLRRRAQLLARRPDVVVRPVRGNVGTRLSKLDAGEFDALLLACAGLDRLGLEGRIAERIDVADSLPAAGQGALGVECLEDRRDLLEMLAPLADEGVARCVAAERGVSAALGADCSLPLAAYATTDGVEIRLQALLASADGLRVLRAERRGRTPAEAARGVATDLRAQGADDILDALRGSTP